jgi:tRNA A-37 threonylcarbamoyl transferase component Bud32
MNLNSVIAERPNKTIYRDGDRRIKVFNKDFSKADVLNEALNQAKVEETELHIPKVLEVTMIEGCWAIIAEFIEGSTLAELINKNPEKTLDYIDLMVDLQIKTHIQKCPQLPNRLYDKMLRKISLTNFDPVIKYELHAHLEGMPRHSKLCHGDFRPSNIIITPQNVPYIIDWSHVTLGNASADVARTYLLFLLADQKDIGEYYINKFSEKTSTARDYIEKWVRIVAASQSVKGNKEELEFLSAIVDVVDYT